MGFVNEHAESGYISTKAKGLKTGGGSKKGRKNINWMVPPFAYFKIAAQQVMYTRCQDCDYTRNFGGHEMMEGLLNKAEKDFKDDVYEALLNSRGTGIPRTKDQMLGVIYDRGHKGYFWNNGALRFGEDGRAQIAPEHWKRSERLGKHFPKAQEILGRYWLSKKKKK